MKIKNILFSSILLTLVTGCASSVPITSPSGKKGHAIDCSLFSIAQCYEKAGKVCGGKGYKILDKKNKSEGFFTSANKTLVIECN